MRHRTANHWQGEARDPEKTSCWRAWRRAADSSAAVAAAWPSDAAGRKDELPVVVVLDVDRDYYHPCDCGSYSSAAAAPADTSWHYETDPTRTDDPRLDWKGRT